MHAATLAFLTALVGATLAAVATAQPAAADPRMPAMVSAASDIKFDSTAPTATGTPVEPGIRTRVLYGDPAKRGLTTVLVSIGPNKHFEPLTHPNDGFVTVLSGRWYVGFGTKFDKSKLIALGAGGIYTEPGNQYHYGETRDETAVMAVTTYDPSGLIVKKD